MYALGPSNGTLTVRTGRGGVAARAGHDLTLEVGRWTASLNLSRADPKESLVRVDVDATSLRVRDGSGGVKPLTDADRLQIEGIVNQKVLSTDRHREVSFVSTAIDAVDGARWQVHGDLTINGITSQVEFPIELDSGPDGRSRVRARVTVTQSSFGIKPFSALMGSLQVADEVEISAEAWAASGVAS